MAHLARRFQLLIKARLHRHMAYPSCTHRSGQHQLEDGAYDLLRALCGAHVRDALRSSLFCIAYPPRAVRSKHGQGAVGRRQERCMRR
jgi:hypothetical protein